MMKTFILALFVYKWSFVFPEEIHHFQTLSDNEWLRGAFQADLTVQHKSQSNKKKAVSEQLRVNTEAQRNRQT